MDKETFEAYLAVQKSGKTNMFNTRMVEALSDGVVTREDCLDIMKNYAKYEVEFGITINDL